MPQGDDDIPPAETLDPDRPSPALLVAAYRRGIFPMAEPGTDHLDWYSPDPRAVFPLDAFHVPGTVARLVRGRRFDIEADRDFEAVMRACGPGRTDGAPTWIDDRLIGVYAAMFAAGHAHSIEARRAGRLVGGLYGVHVGGAFFGESMFIRPDLGGSGASKVCLVHLVEHLRRRGFTLLDTQFSTPHLDRFGCVEIRRHEYIRRLTAAIALPVTWGTFPAIRAACARAHDD